jgi:predicted nucleic acid-binding protein
VKIFLDTNIFLDFLLARESKNNARKIFEIFESSYFGFYLADITLINIDYIAKKEIADLREFLKYINNNCTTLGGTSISFEKALNMENSDLEDNVQYCLALEQGCDYIVTNDKSFLKKDIKIISSEEFVLKYVG